MPRIKSLQTNDLTRDVSDLTRFLSHLGYNTVYFRGHSALVGTILDSRDHSQRARRARSKGCAKLSEIPQGRQVSSKVDSCAGLARILLPCN